MRISFTPPRAGQILQIELQLEKGESIVEVLVAGLPITQRSFDCPDPPCYQTLKVALPATVEGRVLEVRGSDRRGPIFERATIR